jgi:hypothetical protein
MFASFLLTLFAANTGAYSKLTKDLPTETLFYSPIILSVCISVAIQFIFQLFFFYNV